MTAEAHEWVEEYANFEAVLRCTNELGSWDKSATLRAYQTFGWDDASTPGNDLSFSHGDAGVMVRHDGDVVAIDFGNGRLSEALPDLFSVLSALGWLRAEVFHPSETLGALLADMGKAIPAQMDFDVSAAKTVTAISSFAEGATLVERGKAVLRGGLSSFNELALGELEAMAPPDFGNGYSAGIQSPRASGPIALVDDFDEGGGDITHNPVQLAAPSIRETSQRNSSFDDSDTPPVFIIPTGNESYAASAPRAAQVEPATEPAQVPLPLNPSGEVANRPQPVESNPAREQSVLTQPAAPIDVKQEHPISTEKAVPLAASGKVVEIGRSAFIFDLPHEPVSVDEVNRIVDSHHAKKIVHLWPGQVGQSNRWDVLGEIDPAFPWFAEKMAAAMNCGPVGCALLASVLLGLKRSDPEAQLRDVLNTFFASGWDSAEEEVAQTILGVIGSAAKPLFRPSHQRLNMESLIVSFGGLLICQDGDAFVDVRQISDDQSAKEAHKVFTVREVMESTEARIYVVHVDQLDGPFVLSIVELLRWVAGCFAGTTRQAKAAEANRDIEARQQKQEKIVGEVREVLGGLLGRLSELGIKI